MSSTSWTRGRLPREPRKSAKLVVLKAIDNIIQKLNADSSPPAIVDQLLTQLRGFHWVASEMGWEEQTTRIERVLGSFTMVRPNTVGILPPFTIARNPADSDCATSTQNER